MADPSEKNWKPFIDHNPAIKIDGIDFFAGHIVVSEREGGLTHLRVIDLKTKQSHRIATDEPDYALSLARNPEFNTTTVRYTYQSMVTPSSIYDYDMNDAQAHAAEAAGGARRLRPDDVRSGSASGRRRATARRCRCRSSIARRASKLDGKAPLLLYAYGSYGASMTPTFSSSRLSLLDRGVIYAHRPHPRRRRARRRMARSRAA